MIEVSKDTENLTCSKERMELIQTWILVTKQSIASFPYKHISTFYLVPLLLFCSFNRTRPNSLQHRTIVFGPLSASDQSPSDC